MTELYISVGCGLKTFAIEFYFQTVLFGVGALNLNNLNINRAILDPFNKHLVQTSILVPHCFISIARIQVQSVKDMNSRLFSELRF